METFLRNTQKGKHKTILQSTLMQSGATVDDPATTSKHFHEEINRERFAGKIPRNFKPFIASGVPQPNDSETTLRASTPYKSFAERDAQAKAAAAKQNISHQPFITAFKRGMMFEDTLVS